MHALQRLISSRILGMQQLLNIIFIGPYYFLFTVVFQNIVCEG